MQKQFSHKVPNSNALIINITVILLTNEDIGKLNSAFYHNGMGSLTCRELSYSAIKY